MMDSQGCSPAEEPTGGSTDTQPVSGESCPSLKSDCSRDAPLLFRRGTAASDSQSLRSDCSKELPLCFRTEPGPSLLQPKSEGLSDVHQNQLELIFMRLEEDVLTFVKEQLQRFQSLLRSETTPEITPGRGSDSEERSREAVLNITLDFLRRMDQEQLAERLSSSSSVGIYRDKLKRRLQHKYSQVFEGVAKAGSPAPLQQIYTELYITEGGSSEVNQEHEVRHIESASRKPTECSITCEEMFKRPIRVMAKGVAILETEEPIRTVLTKAEAGVQEEEPIRTVLTKGVAGVGKTVLTQKFSLDWAEGRANQDVQLLFPFTFRELNVLRGSEFSLMQLLQHFFSQTKGLRSFDGLQLLFIFDGLDECRLPLDFSRTRVLTDPTESASVEELLVNLIRGDLLPSARLWITTRPAAANQIPAWCVSMVTEVRGFTDPQKEQYFRKRFKDKDQATAVISHIKSIRSLYSMCYIPVFGWILSTVIQALLELLKEPKLPKTLTEMYVHYLVVQAKVKNIKYHEGTGADLHWTPETREMVRSLGKLAFEELQKGNLIFYESDLSKCGLNAEEIARYSGVFTQVFREEPGLYQDKVYCFIHLTVQEFLAALHVHETFFSSGENLLSPSHSSESSVFYRSAVDQALQSPNGHLDLLLRFLLGLSLPTNQRLLIGLLTQTGSDRATQETVKYIQQKLNEEDVSTERSLNLLYCLNELNDYSLLQEIIAAKSLTHSSSPAHWAALSFFLLSSDLEVFDLKNYHCSEWALLKLLPVVKSCSIALLSDCNLTERCCGALSSLLSSDSCTLKVLDLSNNPIQDSGVEQLCEGLKSATCKLETLSLNCCNLTERSCGLLSSVLVSSSLTHLDVSNNRLLGCGLNLLCAGLMSPLCRLETLRLSGCLISEEGVEVLVSSLTNSRLKELDLTHNNLFHCEHLSTLRSQVHTLRVESVTNSITTKSLAKYYCKMLLDPDTAHRSIRVSDDRSRAQYELVRGFFSFNGPNPKRFKHCTQVLCSTPLTGRCYWEVECLNDVDIAVSYKGIAREENYTFLSPLYNNKPRGFGADSLSWCLRLNLTYVSVIHNGTETRVKYWWDFGSPTRVAVFLDHPRGTISFFRVYRGDLILLHRFSATFTEPLYAGFGLSWLSYVSLV